jgi:hypothetical protein
MAIDEMAKGGVMGSWSRSLWIRVKAGPFFAERKKM